MRSPRRRRVVGRLAALVLAVAASAAPAANVPPALVVPAAPAAGAQQPQDPLAPAAAAGARGVSGLYEPGEQAVWVFEQRGQPIGEQLFRYDGSAALGAVRAHRFRSWVRIDAVDSYPEQRFTSDLWVDDGGRPLRHVLHAAFGEVRSSVELTVAAGRVSAHVVQASGARDLEFPVPEGVGIQANNVLGPFELLLALDPPTEGAPLRMQLLSSNALSVIPYECTWVRAEQRAVDGGTRTVSVLQDSLGETLTVDDEGRLLQLEVPSQALLIRRADERVVEPFELLPPAVADAAWDAFDVEEVTITHGEVRLAGSLTRPRGVAARLPALFFLSGSGLQDRHGFSAGIDLGTRQILDRLTAAGFAVLRVDDRGAGASEGPLEALGYDDLLADARACVDFLLARQDVDPRRVALIGHSEGGLTAPILAAERPAIAALVLMAAAGRPLLDVILEQNARALEGEGLGEDERAATLEEIRRVLEQLAGEGELDESALPEIYRPMLAVRPWLQQHARQDPLRNLGAVRCPVLIVQGELDFQVSAERDAPLLAAALDEAGHDDHELVVFPGLDHLFKRARGKQSSFADYFAQRPVAPEFLARLETWLVAHLMPEG